MMKKLIFFFVGFGLTLLFLELFVRYAEIETPLVAYYDDDIGRKYKPNSIDASYKEGFGLYKTNKLGYFFPEYNYDSNNCVYISLISDSYINGRYVFDRDHIRGILENELNNKSNGSKEYRVLKFGQVGGNISDFYIWEKKESQKFKCKYTFIFIDNEDFIVYPTDLGPYCELKDSSIKINYSFHNKKKYQFSKKLMPLSQSSLLRLGLKCLKKRKDYIQIIFQIKKNTKTKKRDNYPSNYLSELNKAIIRELAYEGVIFVLKNKLDNDLMAFFDNNKIKYINLLPILCELEEKGVDPRYWKATKMHGHWNHFGQIAVSQILYGYIENLEQN